MTLTDWLKMGGILILVCITIAISLLFLAAVFAAPGFVILMLSGYQPLGFWMSAITGFGSIVLITTMASAVRATRCKQ